MSESFLTNYRTAREQRLGRNDARRIRAERDKARSGTSGATRRWPFELLQNAHDPGPRAGSKLVDVTIGSNEAGVCFKHNGRPFTLADLAALLSGGSNKEYDSPDTTGRYGTGFLVTHILSPKLRITGIMADGPRHETFQVDLDRSGDEDAILASTQRAEAGIEAATVIDQIDGAWTAEFEYVREGSDAAHEGIETTRISLPYLFGTCQQLGRVMITEGGLSESWTPEEPTLWEYAGTRIRERQIAVRTEDSLTRFRVLRFMPADVEHVGLVVLLRTHGDGWEFIPSSRDLPRVFSRFPVRTSTFLPITAVVDGLFEVQEERDRIAMSEEDKRRIAAGLGLFATAVERANEEKWVNRHWLARLTKVGTGFSEIPSAAELEWWNAQLRAVADRLSRLPLVDTTSSFLPGSSETDGAYADFVVPRYSRSILGDEFSSSRSWELAAATKNLCPPVRVLADDWNVISSGWVSLGTSVDQVGLKEMADTLRSKARTLGDLPVKCEPRAWLASYLSLINELPDGHDRSELVRALLPSQSTEGTLCSPSQLKRDGGIPDELKGIAEAIGCGVKGQLLDQDLAGRAPEALIATLIPAELTEDEVLAHCLEHLNKNLPDGRAAKEETMPLMEGGCRLLRFIWSTRGVNGAPFARRCPVLTREGTIAHHTAKRIMAPVAAWPERAQAYADIYAPSRVLGDLYHTQSEGEGSLLHPLVEWGLAFPEPLIRERRPEVDEALLREITHENVDRVTVRNEEFSQVALLATEVIQRCQDDPDRAALLFGFVLAYLSSRDQAWGSKKPVVGTRDGNPVPLMVRDALWVAELKRAAWVPLQGQDRNQRVPPSAATLGALLAQCKQILVDNDTAIQLLIELFGFDVLTLRLEGLPDDVKNRVSQQLAALVQMGGSDPAFYQRVVDDVEAQKRREAEKARNRQFGLAVQDAIEAYLASRGLKVEVIDCGYDLDVEVPDSEPLLDAGTHRFSVGPYHLEVKATTSGEVRLTPAQARVASGDDRFVLCVVDLRGSTPGRVIEPWTAEDVRPLAHVVTGLRKPVGETHDLIASATTQLISVRNEGKLRYGVPTTIWEPGIQIEAWVDRIAPTLRAK